GEGDDGNRSCGDAPRGTNAPARAAGRERRTDSGERALVSPACRGRSGRAQAGRTRIGLRAPARARVAAQGRDLARGPGLVGKLDRWYVAEITAVAERLGFSVYDMAMIQQQYTWGHLGGCTTTAFWDERRGEAVHVRSLDWAMVDQLSDATRILECFGRPQD